MAGALTLLAGGGASGDIITLTAKTLSSLSSGDGSSYELLLLVDSNGRLRRQFFDDGAVIENSVIANGEWRIPLGESSDYEARATLVSGTLGGTLSSALNTWISTSTDPRWGNTNSILGAGTVTGVALIEIRDAAAPNAVRASANITIQNTVS